MRTLAWLTLATQQQAAYVHPAWLGRQRSLVVRHAPDEAFWASVSSGNRNSTNR